MRARTARWQVYKWGRSYWIALPPIGEYCPSERRMFDTTYPEGYIYWDWDDAYGLAYERAMHKALIESPQG